LSDHLYDLLKKMIIKEINAFFNFINDVIQLFKSQVIIVKLNVFNVVFFSCGFDIIVLVKTLINVMTLFVNDKDNYSTSKIFFN
jgi:hypothetical protein